VSLDNLRFVTVNEYNGQTYVHFRQYECNEAKGTTFATPKGCSLTPDAFALLVINTPLIDKAVERMEIDGNLPQPLKVHLGNNVYCKIENDYKCVDIRHYFQPEGESKVVPTKKGLSLTFNEWKIFRDNIDRLKNLSAELNNACNHREYYKNY